MLKDLVKDIKNKVLLAVWLNFVENKKHGCSKSCYFCNFIKNPIYMCPTEENLREYVETYMKYSPTRSILLSGGGDPLFNFTKNREKIEMILRVCKELNVEVVLQSGEFDVVKEELNTLFKDINLYYFSSETEDEELHNLAATLLAANKKVVITKVFNSSSDIEKNDYEDIDSWVNFYRDSCSSMQLRENYNKQFNSEKNDKLCIDILERYCKDGKHYVSYRPYCTTINKFIGLVNDTVMWGQEFIFTNK